MRILFDEQIFSSQRFGGISRYYSELVKALGTKDDVSAKLVSPLCTNHYAKNISRSTRFGIPVPVMPGTETLLWHFNRQFSKRYIRHYNPDILHQTYYLNNNRRPCSGSRVVTTVHDMIHELFPAEFPDPERMVALKLQAVKNADLVICVSENTRKDLLRITGIEQAKTVVIHHGINHIESLPLPAPRPKGKPYLLYVGLRHIYKNFHRVLKAYARNPGLMSHYDLVCFGGGNLTEKEKNMISQLNIPLSNVILARGNDMVLGSFYQHAEAFLYPSLYEGFGLPPLEAMMQGCPVISSNVSCLPEVLGTAAEYFDPNDTDDLVKSIARVVNNQPRSDELKMSGLAHAQKFTWNECAEKTLKSYREIV